MPGARAGGRPGGTLRRAGSLARLVTIPVPIGAALGRRGAVPVIAGAAWCGHRDLLVQNAEGGLHVRVADRQLAEPDQLLEPAVDHGALVHGGAAVAEAVGDGGVRVAGLGQPDEVARRVGPAGGDRPGLDVALEVVRGRLVDLRPGEVAVLRGDGRGGGQPGDLGGDRGRGVAGLLLPPLHPERRPVRHQEVRGRPDVVLPQLGVPAQPGLPGHQDRVGRLVELGAAGVRCRLAVEQGVARHRPVRELLPVEQEQCRRARIRDVPVGQQPGERLVQVAGEHLAVGAEVGRLAVVEGPGGHRLPPGAGQRGHDRAGVGLVFAGLDHVRGQVVPRPQLRDPVGGHACKMRGRPAQPGVIAEPSGQVPAFDGAKRLAQRIACGRDGLLLGAPETKGQRDRVAAGRRDVLGGHDVTVRRAGVDRRQGVGGVELGQAVAGAARVAHARGGRRAAGLERHVRGHRVVAVGRVGDGVGAVDHRDGVRGGGVDHAGVAARVLAAAASVAVDVRVEPRVQVQARHAGAGPGQRRQAGVHEHGVAARVGDVGGDELVAVLAVGRGHGAGHAGGVGADRVGHVPGLEVGERGPVGDDVLQRAHVGVVDGRLVHVGQHPAGDRVPDLGPGAGRGADAVLPRQVVVGLRARRPGGHRVLLPDRPAGRGSVAGLSAGRGERQHRQHDRRRREDRQSAPADAHDFLRSKPARPARRNGVPQPGRVRLRSVPSLPPWPVRVNGPA